MMPLTMAQPGYNERLFSGVFRRWLHLARFRWLCRRLRRLSCPYDRVIELGCFDGKLIDLLPRRPRRYLGLDANWEGGLDLARQRWRDVPGYEFRLCRSAEEMFVEDGPYELGVAMETLEHVAPALADAYLEGLARCVRGHLFVTVPNEKGLFLLAKTVIRRLACGPGQKYTAAELLNGVLGRMDKIERIEHKGFDYAVLVKQVDRYFRVLEVSGHPLEWMPRCLCFGIGIVAVSR